MAETTTKALPVSGTNPVTFVHDLQEQLLDGVRKGQDLIVEATKGWVGIVQHTSLKPPAVSALVGLDRVEQFVADTYRFATKVLETQRQFDEKLFKAVEPVLSARA